MKPQRKQATNTYYMNKNWVMIITEAANLNDLFMYMIMYKRS